MFLAFQPCNKIPGDTCEALQRHASASDQILAHSGGRDVIEAIESTLPFYLTEIREVLRKHGNMSNLSVLFALGERSRNCPDETALWLTAFGAGFAADSCRLSSGQSNLHPKYSQNTH